MAILNNEALLSRINAFVGDRTDDDALSFIEDLTDTYNDITNKNSGTEDWKQKYEDNDKEWREKYRNRFFSGGNGNEPTPQPNEPNEVNDDISIDDLFN